MVQDCHGCAPKEGEQAEKVQVLVEPDRRAAAIQPKIPEPSSATAQRAALRNHDVALMGAFRAGLLSVSIGGGLAEVSPRIHTGCVDVVVFGEIAHGFCC